MSSVNFAARRRGSAFDVVPVGRQPTNLRPTRMPRGRCLKRERRPNNRVESLAPEIRSAAYFRCVASRRQTRKRLDIERIAQIKSATRVPLTLHGGSGTDDEDLRKAIAAGINIIHVNTELRVAWRRGLEEGLAKQPTMKVGQKCRTILVISLCPIHWRGVGFR